MEAFQARYEGVDRVLDHIKKLVTMQRQKIHISSPLMGSTNRLSTNPCYPDAASTGQMITWADAIVFQPRTYLRINMMVDIALCRGDFPADFDLPYTPLLLQPSVTRTRPPNGGFSKKVACNSPHGLMQSVSSVSGQTVDQETPSSHSTSESDVSLVDNYRVDSLDSARSGEIIIEEDGTDLYTICSPTLTSWAFYRPSSS
ncbi:hypothetical protein H2198_004249 [Neophaeococcomyces mojaviensis]|uniref:Uncharacterized protein n=1 Tax=Neophaeococcomyces mojaviensis TaxID=3383035 RepID=A0ACC3A9B5_9EURO|nr:hypothetical protein H2198_004249 [Knufia sp. JES_112]